jgi:hypothetical protein
MTKDEALRLAWDALQQIAHVSAMDYEYQQWAVEAITAIKEALAQPEQEPVAYINVEQRKLEWAKYMSWDTPTVANLPKIPLYTTPPQRTWVNLTSEEIGEIYRVGWANNMELARAIEAKLKEKNERTI